MNARQKAKKYKKELERLRSSPIKPQIVYEYPKVVTLKAGYILEDDVLDDTHRIRLIYDHLCGQFIRSEEFREAVKFEMHGNQITATLKVLR